jgi:hypothetical protein
MEAAGFIAWYLSTELHALHHVTLHHILIVAAVPNAFSVLRTPPSVATSKASNGTISVFSGETDKITENALDIPISLPGLEPATYEYS